ncbi:MAG: putative Fe-S cluster assembly protein SufT [Deltaproteobacteria bacterium]|nr:putative Fe-S cluster assembly protein SufT [Deltaproteobacteria bacterium]
MQEREHVQLTRKVEAIVIPDGYKVDLEKGSEVTITQSLGGAFTVTTDQGYMVRIDGKDADALGKVVEKAGIQGSKTIEEKVWEELKTCYDPEIPVDIVNLGLVYACNVVTLENGKYKIDVRFTLTAPGCGMGDILKSDIESKLLNIDNVEMVDVAIVLDPPWDQSRMSEEAKLKLGLI